MSIYFAKYLPVLTEMKDGDLVTADGVNHLWSKYNKIANPNCIEGFNALKKEGLNPVKVKLFLCGKTALLPLVVAEINPELRWIKEGDEFEEKDVRFTWWPDEESSKGFGSFELMEVSETYQELIEHGYFKAHLKEIYIQAQVRCPHCNHFV